MSTRRRVAALMAAALVAMTAGLGAASAAPAGYHRYVALGDSFTSGPLIPLQRLDPLGCLRSTNDYPAWLADTLDVESFTDVSCSGADTTNMTAPQSIPFGTAPPQFDALRTNTDLVTVGLGGNDFGVFGELTSVCPGLRAQDPTGAPCRDRYTVDGVDTVTARIPAIQARVAAVLSGVHQRSPGAKVALVGYLRIAPPTGHCPDILPFADGDLRWVDSVQRALNGALSAAAAHDGATTFVDTYGPSLGHDACASHGGSAAWIQGKDLNLIGAAAYHPRRAGMAAVAGFIHTALTGTRAATGDGTPEVTAGLPVAGQHQVSELVTTTGVSGG